MGACGLVFVKRGVSLSLEGFLGGRPSQSGGTGTLPRPPPLRARAARGRQALGGPAGARGSRERGPGGASAQPAIAPVTSVCRVTALRPWGPLQEVQEAGGGRSLGVLGRRVARSVRPPGSSHRQGSRAQCPVPGAWTPRTEVKSGEAPAAFLSLSVNRWYLERGFLGSVSLMRWNTPG